MENNTILLLVDYRNCFYSTTRPKELSMDLNKIEEYFGELGYKIIIQRFNEINFRNYKLPSKYVLYQSSEDRDLLYKNYIEDILLAIQLKGGILIPDFSKFRAHHNKVFMEILRDLNPIDSLKKNRTNYYGTYEEFLENKPSFEAPYVVKSASGTGSKEVRLAVDFKHCRNIVKSLSSSFFFIDTFKDKIKTLIRPYHKPISNHRRKFIIQEFIPDLKNDYKILVFNKKYYVLIRNNRKNDFRASGAGLFEWSENIPFKILDFAQEVFNSFKVPYISMDIAYTNDTCYLIEFQFLMFGPYTLEKSEFYFVNDNDFWKVISEKSVFEKEFSNSVINYIKNKL